MKLSDIIKNDGDRLFIVDTECFIIFTGGSINDDRPFIRIGTWSDLPVEIIPLVENIIVSDRILGNPAIEQFNINVRNLSTNRYIGGESILKRFLDYQRNFGLDLTNVSVVNIEKDIPELTDKKSVSDRDQFIGVFYSNGNIKIVHDGNDIFDLNSIYGENLNITEMFGRLTQKNKNTPRYNGTGFVISDKNPIFYSNGYFTSYQFPSTYLDDFSLLEIDPVKIRELLLPSHNMIPVSDLMKYRHVRGGKIRIFSDNRDQIDLIKKLFKGAIINDEPFSEMNYSTGNGMTITAHSGTPNIRITYNPDIKQNRGLTAYFIKSPSDIKSILKESCDIIIISYTAYEQSVLLFKSVQKPVIILNDGNPNIRKISGTDTIILKKGVQYDLKIYDSSDELKRSIETDSEFFDAVNNENITAIENWFEQNISKEHDYSTIFNSISLLRIQISTTKDRKLYSSLRSIIQKYSALLEDIEPAELKQNTYVEIAICNKSSFQILRNVTRKSREYFTERYDHSTINNILLDSDQRKLAERIIEDRERLANVLALFYEEKESLPSFPLMKSELSLLKNEIENRREIYTTEFYDTESYIRAKKNRLKKKILNKAGKMEKQESGSTASLFKKYQIPFMLLFFLILLIAGGLIISNSTKKEQPVITEQDLSKKVENKNIVVTVKRVDSEERKLLVKHNVKITDYDIFNYANDVAIKNGYSGLSLDGLKKKNPHWIYPSNVFIMLDGEKVVVQKGDTLWDLSHAKLEKMNAEFFKITDQLEKADPSDRERINKILTDARKYIYTTQQKKFIEEYKVQYLKNE